MKTKEELNALKEEALEQVVGAIKSLLKMTRIKITTTIIPVIQMEILMIRTFANTAGIKLVLFP